MKENINLNCDLNHNSNHNINNGAEIVGHVTVDYVDKLTGKVKERVKGKNMAFLESFDSINWVDYQTNF